MWLDFIIGMLEDMENVLKRTFYVIGYIIYHLLFVELPKAVRTIIRGLPVSLLAYFGLVGFITFPLILFFIVPESSVFSALIALFGLVWVLVIPVLLVVGLCVAYVVTNDHRDMPMKKKILKDIPWGIFYFIFCIAWFVVLFGIIAAIDHHLGIPFMSGI